MTENESPLRKLAVLVDSLDTETANRFLNKIPDRTADEIRQYVVDLGRVNRSEREQVLQQFMFAVHGVQQSVFKAEEDLGQIDKRIRPVAPAELPKSTIASRETRPDADQTT